MQEKKIYGRENVDFELLSKEEPRFYIFREFLPILKKNVLLINKEYIVYIFREI